MSQYETEISHLQALFADRTITRRDFMGRAAALGLTTALATTLAGEAAKAATPKQGGLMKLAMGHGSTTDTYDPAVIENGFQWVLAYAISNTLVELSAANHSIVRASSGLPMLGIAGIAWRVA